MSPTITVDRLRGQLSPCVLAVRVTVANVPWVDTAPPGLVMAPNTPVTVPARLSILPELKKVLAPPCPRRSPSLTLSTVTREGSKLRSNCIPAMAVPGTTDYAYGELLPWVNGLGSARKCSLLLPQQQTLCSEDIASPRPLPERPPAIVNMRVDFC